MPSRMRCWGRWMQLTGAMNFCIYYGPFLAIRPWYSWPLAMAIACLVIVAYRADTAYTHDIGYIKGRLHAIQTLQQAIELGHISITSENNHAAIVNIFPSKRRFLAEEMEDCQGARQDLGIGGWIWLAQDRDDCNKWYCVLTIDGLFVKSHGFGLTPGQALREIGARVRFNRPTT